MGSTITTGKILLTLNGLITSIVPYMADWSETHVLNPRWPPHAKFHNGQTMSMGLGLGLLTMYYTWRPSPSLEFRKDSLNSAVISATLYYVTGLSGILYPGTKWTDPEFGEGNPQAYAFIVFAAVGCLGWALERRRLGKGKTV